MKIVKLKGGLGNQMFQYAYAKLLECRSNDNVKLDFSAFASLKNDAVRVPRIARFSLSLENATYTECSKAFLFPHKGNSQSFGYRCGIFLEKTLNRNYFFEPNRAYIEPDTLMKYSYYDGYWQSYRYVDEVAEQLRADFVPKNSLSEKSMVLQNIMKTQNAVFVGVRRGDYSAEQNHYGSFSSNYYKMAMDLIASKTKDPVFYIFSNDIDWCKTGIDWGTHHVVFREKEDQFDDFEELLLMASCNHAIIVNSSYNWWGAYLITNPQKIIVCPEKWFFDDSPIDIIPPTWTRIKEI